MARCKDCIHNDVCRYHDKLAKIDEYNWFSYNELDNVQDFCEHFIADVVPKSEVEELKTIIKDYQANEERWQELYFDTVNKWEKAYEELEIQLEKAKAEVAREIFEEIEHRAYGFGCCFVEMTRTTFDEIKKKYTESETILGECKFTEQISQEQPDLSDAKFIDEDGNVTTPADWQDWNETPPWEESEDKNGNI